MGNVYVTGYFRDTVDFDPGTDTDSHTSSGGIDIFVTKVNADGTYGWTKTMGGSSGDYGYSVAVDSDGNVFVTGYFQGTADFAPGTDTDSHTSSGYGDIFVTKINSDGTYGWTKTMGGSYYDGGQSVAVDSDGNIYVTGFFYSGAEAYSVDFDPGTDTTDEHTTSSSDGDNFVTKINADGTYGWTKTTSGSDEVHTCSVAVDSSGNLYVTGALYGTADFDPGTGTDEHTSSGSYDIFLMKFSQ